jgi:hypothetical protein
MGGFGWQPSNLDHVEQSDMPNHQSKLATESATLETTRDPQTCFDVLPSQKCHLRDKQWLC